MSQKDTPIHFLFAVLLILLAVVLYLGVVVKGLEPTWMHANTGRLMSWALCYGFALRSERRLVSAALGVLSVVASLIMPLLGLCGAGLLWGIQALSSERMRSLPLDGNLLVHLCYGAALPSFVAFLSYSFRNGLTAGGLGAAFSRLLIITGCYLFTLKATWKITTGLFGALTLVVASASYPILGWLGLIGMYFLSKRKSSVPAGGHEVQTRAAF